MSLTAFFGRLLDGNRCTGRLDLRASSALRDFFVTGWRDFWLAALRLGAVEVRFADFGSFADFLRLFAAPAFDFDVFLAETVEGRRGLCLVKPLDTLGKCLATFPDFFVERLAGFLVFLLADFLVKADIRDARSHSTRGGWTMN